MSITTDEMPKTMGKEHWAKDSLNHLLHVSSEKTAFS
jgi:hypothetical protein